jgi:hypothetical protein
MSSPIENVNFALVLFLRYSFISDIGYSSKTEAGAPELTESTGDGLRATAFSMSVSGHRAPSE